MQQDLQAKLTNNSESGSGFLKEEDGNISGFGKDEGGDNSNSEQNAKIKKKYSVITQEVREKFIKRVTSREVTIKEAAKEFGIKFSTSKAILQTYKREGRIGKKKTRQRRLSHSEQENVAATHNSPKTQPQFKGTNKNGTTEDALKNPTNNTARQHTASGIGAPATHLYRNTVTHPVGGGLEMSDPTMMDTDLKNTIYEMQATIQDGYPMYDPNMQTPLLHTGMLKGNEGLLHHNNFQVDQLSQANKLSQVTGGLLNAGLSASLLGQANQLGQPGASQLPSLMPNYPYQFGNQYPGQSLYPGMYNPYAFNQQNAFSNFNPQFYPQLGQQNPMMYQMQQQHPGSARQQAQKIPRGVIYSNPFNSNSTSATTENQGPTYPQIRDQIKNINTDTLRQNAAQFQNKDFERENEYNYQKYYLQ